MLRRGDWIQTYRGERFYPLDPRADEVHIEDIAHALGNLCRFAGHTSRFYSVAEHCVHVSLEVPAEYALWGLLHDAAEAYVVDLPRPIKHAPGLEVYRAAERAVMAAVCERFGLELEQPAPVTRTDNDMLLTERRDLMRPRPEHDAEWSMGAHGSAAALPWVDLSIPHGPVTATQLFLGRYTELTRR